MEDKLEPGDSPEGRTSPVGALGNEKMSDSQDKGTKAPGELADYDGITTPPAEVSFPAVSI